VRAAFCEADRASALLAEIDAAEHGNRSEAGIG
jgi:hypothetical protein